MRKMGKTTEMGSKVFHLNNEDIELIVSLLHEECDHHVYHKNGFKNPDKEFFKERYDHIQDLIMELTK
jgi:hypothetical protein